MIHVTVDQLFLSNMGFVVLLKGIQDDRSLPIFIGAAEAQSIALSLNNVDVPRPMTHDLLKNILDYLECRIVRIEICSLKEGTFFARMVLVRDGAEMEIDSRPSDAIAVALRSNTPVYVADKVMEEAGNIITVSGDEVHAGPADKPIEKKAVKAASPLQSLNKALAKAVKEERYEDAARLRDEIAHLKDSHKAN